MPASRLFVGLVLTTLLAVAGLVVPVAAGLALACDGLLVGLFFIDLRRARRIPVEAWRTWPAHLVQGQVATVSLEVRCPGGGATVRLRETSSPRLVEAPPQVEVAVPAGSGWRWQLDLVPRRRGACSVGPLMARVRGPWGLAWSQRQLLPGASVRVLPQVRWEGRVGRLLLLAQRGHLGHNPLALQGLGREFYGLREYRPGDPRGRIHWKASARVGRLVAREDTWESGARLVILLDCGRSMSSSAASRSKLDHALAAALALARVAVARGDRVSLAAFSNRLERTVRLHGRGSVASAYAALYDLEASLAEPAYDLLAEIATTLEARRATIVVFTSIVDLTAADLLRSALGRLGRRHRPLLVNLEDAELTTLAKAAPADVAAAFAKVGALQILLANQEMARRLRRHRVRVVNASADRLALSALEAYLEAGRSRPRL